MTRIFCRLRSKEPQPGKFGVLIRNVIGRHRFAILRQSLTVQLTGAGSPNCVKGPCRRGLFPNCRVSMSIIHEHRAVAAALGFECQGLPVKGQRDRSHSACPMRLFPCGSASCRISDTNTMQPHQIQSFLARLVFESSRVLQHQHIFRLARIIFFIFDK
jgi:hypothetical protein